MASPQVSAFGGALGPLQSSPPVAPVGTALESQGRFSYATAVSTLGCTVDLHRGLVEALGRSFETVTTSDIFEVLDEFFVLAEYTS